jgi:hypothetical protein
MNAKTIGKWLFLIGLLVSIVVGLLSLSLNWLTWILMIVGILSAILYFDHNDVVNVGIRFLVLAAVASAFDGFIAIGPFITAIFTAAVGFLAPVVLTLLVVWFVKERILK